MASLDNLEGDVTEGAGALIAVGIVALLIVLYMAWRKLSVPVALYPSTIAGNFATGVDKVMNSAGMTGTARANSVNNWLANLVSWFTSNTPDPTKSKAWADYEAQTEPGGMQIATQDLSGQ